MKYLITYSKTDGYNLFTEDYEKYIVKIDVFGEREINALEEPEVSNFYRRQIVTEDVHTEAFDLTSQGSKRYELETSYYVFDIDEDNSFAVANSNILKYHFEIENGIVTLVLDEESIPSNIRVQITYKSCVPLIEGTTYTVDIKKETETQFTEESWICRSDSNEQLYVGDYEYFMGSDDEPEPESDISTFTAEQESAPFYANIDYQIELLDGHNDYKVTFVIYRDNNDELEYIYYCTAQENEFVGTYIGNLSLYDSSYSDTGEKFCLISQNWKDTPDANRIYVPDPGGYGILIDHSPLIPVPELAGGALMSLGKIIESAGETYMEDNYGIGINSSDNYLTIPKKAISLFETTIEPEQSIKAQFNWRGILGTLPSLGSKSVASLYNEYMVDSQGIYTDNMYIGDEDQYIAFYTDKDSNKHLKIKATDIIYEIDEQGQEVTWGDRIKYFVHNDTGSVVIAGKDEASISFDVNNINTYGFNTLSGANKIALRYDDKEFLELNQNGLEIKSTYYNEQSGIYIEGNTVATYGKDGVTMYDSDDNPIASYGKNIILGSEQGPHITMDSDYGIIFYGAEQQESATISGQYMKIPYTIVLNEMQVGEKSGSTNIGVWTWKLMSNNNLRLIWLGDGEE